MEVGHRAGASTKAIIFSANQVSYSFAPQTKAIFFSANQVYYCYDVLSSFHCGTMPPAVVFIEEDPEVQAFRQRDDWPTGGENWDEELLIPGRMVYIGQGQAQFLPFDQPAPGILYPKRKKKKKKTSQPPPPPPAPVTEPAPIDWSDWEELCQAAPPVLPPPEIWEPEDWDAEIAASQWEPEDWDAEIAASQWEPEDWDAEIAASQWEPEDWDAEISASQ
jgi:hypothetical protein